MIDLRFSELPKALIVGGQDVPIKTDFRTWIEAQRSVAEDSIMPFSIFPNEEPPEGEWVPAALEFLRSKNSCPHGQATATQVEVFDLMEDGDYIVAAFQQAYGIDLTAPDCSMHWHRFLALLRGLPQETKLSEIIGYRGWTEADGKQSFETRAKKLRESWSLPRKADERLKAAQSEWFGDVVKSYMQGNGNPAE